MMVAAGERAAAPASCVGGATGLGEESVGILCGGLSVLGLAAGEPRGLLLVLFVGKRRGFMFRAAGPCGDGARFTLGTAPVLGATTERNTLHYYKGISVLFPIIQS